jgi:uncharacterized protein (TIGR02145 family)
MKVRFLPFLMLPILGMAQANSNGEIPLGGNTSSEKQTLEIKRNASYNLEEIKVRWKKAALENCQGAPCSSVTAPGAPTGVVATVGNGSVSVAFVAPTNNGGRAITGYTVTSNPGNITTPGTTSPIIVTGLTNGTSYTFTVIATNEVGNSLASSTSTAVKSFTCGTGTISDYDGNPYETVLIGTQCWTKQNLRVSSYNDGTTIPLDNTGGMDGSTVTGGIAVTWGGWTTGAYTIYNNQPSTGTNATNYGFLYNWYAAAGIITNLGSPTKNICPVGWHVPSDGEWITLIEFHGGILNNIPTLFSVSAKMKQIGTSLWNNPNNGTDDFGFTALPAGMRDGSDYLFENIKTDAKFWSANGSTLGSYLWINSGPASLISSLKTYGHSIRCLRD